MPDRLIDLLLILVFIFAMWGVFQPEDALDYLRQTWHGLKIAARVFKIG